MYDTRQDQSREAQTCGTGAASKVGAIFSIRRVNRESASQSRVQSRKERAQAPTSTPLFSFTINICAI